MVITKGGIIMGALKLTATIVLVLFEIFLIVVVLLQSSNSPGLSSSFGGGNTETFFGKNKNRSREGRLQRLTSVSAIGFIVLAVIISLIK